MNKKTIIRRRVGCAVLLCMMGASSLRGQDELQGAKVVIDSVSAVLEKADAKDKKGGEENAASMKEQIELLQKKWDSYLLLRDGLTAEQSVTDWLAIFDLFTETSLGAKRMDWSVWKGEQGRTYSLVGEVPDTEAWEQWFDSLQGRAEKSKEKHPEISAYTLFLVEFLKGDKEAAWKSWKSFSKLLREKDVEDDDYQAQQLVMSLDYFEVNIAGALKIDGYKLTKFEQALEKRENLRKDDTSRFSFRNSSSLQVPKLVQLAGKEKATALLKRVFAIKFAENELRFSFDDETAHLAAVILLADPELIRRPHWALIRGIDAQPLYEIYSTKFPEAINSAREEDDYSWKDAIGEVITAHLLKGEIDEAVALAVQNSKKDSTETWVDGGATEKLFSQRKGGLLFNFYKALLGKVPTANVWDSMISLGAKINRSAEVMQLAEGMIGPQQEMNPKTSNRALGLLAKAALADDDDAKGIGYLRQQVILIRNEIDVLLKEPKQNAKQRDQVEDWGGELVSAARQIEKVGTVTKQEDIQKEGTAVLSKWYESRIANYRKGDSDFSTIIEFFIESGDLVQAEKAIRDRVGAEIEKTLKELEKENYPGRNPFNGMLSSDAPEMLIKLYAKAERHQDVVDVFKKWPFWGVFDASQISGGGDDLRFSLVKALEKTGDKKSAAKILKASLLDGHLTSNDDAYAMLLHLEGQNALPTLDVLYARDAFEERPLIWKGRLLLNSGKLKEAEEVIRKAISIDPSDGEQGKGDRMRVYGVLADILTAKGNKEDAKLYREVLKSIRISEDADDIYASGLTSRGIKKYNEALTHFSDAYCIQSRLAKQLNLAGRLDEARVHYRKAFELMPNSFGRMESHCFGCEGIFSGADAASIANQVFTNLIKEQPGKPQVYYLLGYLRSSQDRDKEALELYQKAVQLDPDYINAWKKIAAFGERPSLSLELRDQATIALARLDPYNRHGGISRRNIFDVKGMLVQLESIDSVNHAEKGGLFELTATKAYIEKLVESQLADAGEEYAKQGINKEQLIKQITDRGQDRNRQGPRSAIRQFLSGNQVLSTWHQYYKSLLQSGG